MTWQLVDFVDFENNPEVDSDLMFDVSMKMMEYKRLANPDFDFPEEIKSYLLRARWCFNSALMIVRQTLEPEENKHIRERENKRIWDWFIDNLGRMEKRMDDMEKKIMEVISREEKVRSNKDGSSRYDIVETLNLGAVDANSIRTLHAYKRELDEAVEGLIYYPIKNAIRRFSILPEEMKDKNGNMVKKDKEMFNFFLFVYMSLASNTLGGLAREDEPRRISNQLSTSQTTSGSNMGNIRTRTQKDSPTDIQANAEEALNNYFSMPDELKEEEDAII